jgi:effector-binding domain-containing protein
MKALKKILYVLLSLSVLYAVVCIFLPSEVTIHAEKEMKSSGENVFSLVNEIKNWKGWYPWNIQDPKMSVNYFGPPSGKGAGYDFSSEKKGIGKGKISILNSVPNDSINASIDVDGRKPSVASFYFSEKDSVVSVDWKMKIKLSFFGRLFPGLFLQGMIGKHFQQGLNAMDSIVRTRPVMPKEGIAGVSSFERKNVLCLPDSCPERDISFVISKLYGEIQATFDADTKIEGAPLCIYHSLSENKAVFEAAVCVNKIPAKISGSKIKAKDVLLTKVVVYNYYGSTFEIKKAYSRIAEYLQKNNLQQNGNSIEEYLSDSMQETNAAKWLTRIYVPVE